jgi:hypothetical protein
VLDEANEKTFQKKPAGDTKLFMKLFAYRGRNTIRPSPALRTKTLPPRPTFQRLVRVEGASSSVIVKP